MFVFVSPAVDAEAEEKVCNIQCDSLNKDDYLDLLWTAAAELPGECANHITHHLIAKRFPNYHWYVWLQQTEFTFGSNC